MKKQPDIVESDLFSEVKGDEATNRRISVAEQTAADDTSLGFDFQFYFFLEKLLAIKKGETIGYEVKDDVHIQIQNKLYLFQIKHSLQKTASGTTINMSEKDSDLWKTLANWSKYITDAAEGRDEESIQHKFLDSTEFHLITNKQITDDHNFTILFDQLTNRIISYSEFKNKVTEIGHNNAKNSKYIATFLALSEDVLKSFCRHLFLHGGHDDLIERGKTVLEEKQIPPKAIEKAFFLLSGKIRQDYFEMIKREQKFSVTYDDFQKKYAPDLYYFRSSSLVIIPYSASIQDDLTKQRFIRQLVDIGDIEATDLARIADYSADKLTCVNNISQWLKDGDIVETEITKFDEDAKKRWNNLHHSEFRKSFQGEQEINDAALRVLDKVRNEHLSIHEQQTNTSMSNGEFYHLSDTPEIGWRHDWETRYKK